MFSGAHRLGPRLCQLSAADVADPLLIEQVLDPVMVELPLGGGVEHLLDEPGGDIVHVPDGAVVELQLEDARFGVVRERDKHAGIDGRAVHEVTPSRARDRPRHVLFIHLLCRQPWPPSFFSVSTRLLACDPEYKRSYVVKGGLTRSRCDQFYPIEQVAADREFICRTILAYVSLTSVFISIAKLLIQKNVMES